MVKRRYERCHLIRMSIRTPRVLYWYPGMVVYLKISILQSINLNKSILQSIKFYSYFGRREKEV